LTPGNPACRRSTRRRDDLPIHCGYVAWHRTPKGDYQIIHEEENSIDKGSIATMKPAEVSALAAKFGCTGQ
jgi:hypothetical protein